MWNIRELIPELSQFYHLEPGDLIYAASSITCAVLRRRRGGDRGLVHDLDRRRLRPLEALLAADPRRSVFCIEDVPTLADVYPIPQVESAHRFKVGPINAAGALPRGSRPLMAELTTRRCDGNLANMDAALITSFKDVADDGSIMEMVVWRVPEPVLPTTHGFKYRLVCLVKGKRVVGFDNERGKGDHCHLDGAERPYRFTTLDRLIEDFIAEVAKRRTP